jgi:hypothetical protein
VLPIGSNALVRQLQALFLTASSPYPRATVTIDLMLALTALQLNMLGTDQRSQARNWALARGSIMLVVANSDRLAVEIIIKPSSLASTTH